jgi:DNA polymerase delta subunit 3
MLYEFHRTQNGKHPGSVHAAYLVYGTKKEAEAPPKVGVDGDIEMTSSLPEPEPAEEVIPVHTLSLVQESRLKGMLVRL